MKMSEVYQKRIINNRVAYQRISDRDIRNINTIIFDCDGVLIDRAYNFIYPEEYNKYEI